MPSFPWAPSGQNWGPHSQQPELAIDRLLAGAQLQPLGSSSSSMRRGYSAEALPRRTGSPQVIHASIASSWDPFDHKAYQLSKIAV